MHRRAFINSTVMMVSTLLTSNAKAEDGIKLLFVHGRDQQGQDPAILQKTWLAALELGAKSIGRTLPNVAVSFPFYGDTLAKFADAYDIPLTADIQTKGVPVNDEFLAFEAEVVEELRKKAGISDAEVSAEYGDNPKPKGPQNWEWVQAILRKLDNYGGPLGGQVIELITRDVFLYTRRAGVRSAIDKIVADELSEAPTIVVGHSLGSVVAYNILRTDSRRLNIPLFVTVGSPLGIRAVRDQLRPLKFPSGAKAWYNAFDQRDVVALYPLDGTSFPVSPAITNFDKVINHTDNRHGIAGYLDDKYVAKLLLDGMSA